MLSHLLPHTGTLMRIHLCVALVIMIVVMNGGCTLHFFSLQFLLLNELLPNVAAGLGVSMFTDKIKTKLILCFSHLVVLLVKHKHIVIFCTFHPMQTFSISL